MARFKLPANNGRVGSDDVPRRLVPLFLSVNHAQRRAPSSCENSGQPAVPLAVVRLLSGCSARCSVAVPALLPDNRALDPNI
jgi:hypothetical protein